MAVQPKHQQKNHQNIFDNDFSSEQRQRFTAIANQAETRRELERERNSVYGNAKRLAMKPVVKQKKGKANTARYVIWLMTGLAICIWVMYMGR